MSLQQIPLEDDPCDVIAKAMRGLDLTPQNLAEKTGLSMEDIQSSLDGGSDIVAWELIAPALHLSSSALAELPNYKPNTQIPDGLHCVNTPFGHAGVNAYIIVHGNTASVFDTGTNPAPILKFLDQHKLTLHAVYITHRHHDHTAGVGSFADVQIIYPEMLEPGQQITHGDVLFTVLDASGHLTPGRAFFHEGLSIPVCIVGDSIFAGSMGKTSDPSSYQLALKNAITNILSLPPNTIICPGHGPLTTVELEKNNNPFFKQCLKHS